MTIPRALLFLDRVGREALYTEVMIVNRARHTTIDHALSGWAECPQHRSRTSTFSS
jgi:hypothetical protein